MYVQRNIKARSRDHYCRRRAISITNSECVSAVMLSSMQSACAVFHCHVRFYFIFPHYLINGAILGKKLPSIKGVF